MHYYDNKKIMVIGCGGTGSEIIKLLTLNQSIKKICVVDYDKVELSNLSRQFVYTKNDIGIFKAEVLAKKMKCEFINKKIQDVSLNIINEYDIIFACVDSISSRMDINCLFYESECKILIDCGVEEFKAHAKRIDKKSSCLYCMKDLFTLDNEAYLCSLSAIDYDNIDITNRNKVLKSLILKIKEKNNINKISEENVLESIINDFNSKVDEKLKTTYFEVYGIYNKIIPNICVINSICASMAINIISMKSDFIYYDATDTLQFNQLILEKYEDCILCNKKND